MAVDIFFFFFLKWQVLQGLNCTWLRLTKHNVLIFFPLFWFQLLEIFFFGGKILEGWKGALVLTYEVRMSCTHELSSSPPTYLKTNMTVGVSFKSLIWGLFGVFLKGLCNEFRRLWKSIVSPVGVWVYNGTCLVLSVAQD